MIRLRILHWWWGRCPMVDLTWQMVRDLYCCPYCRELYSGQYFHYLSQGYDRADLRIRRAA